MTNSLFRPKQEASAKTQRPNVVTKIQSAVSRAAKTLRRDISEYRVDLKAAFAKDDD